MLSILFVTVKYRQINNCAILERIVNPACEWILVWSFITFIFEILMNFENPRYSFINNNAITGNIIASKKSQISWRVFKNESEK